MYRVMQSDDSVNSSWIVAECDTIEEANGICNKELEEWQYTWIEEDI